MNDSLRAPATIWLENVLLSAAKAPTTTIFSNPEFQRSHQRFDYGNGLQVEILSDHTAPVRITLVHVRFHSQGVGRLRLSLAHAREAGMRLGYLAPHSDRGVAWLPSGPVARRYDEYLRIEREVHGQLTFSRDSGTLEMSVDVPEGHVVDVPLLQAQGDGRAFEEELIQAEPIEQLRLYQDNWYDVQDVAQLWSYLVFGRIHDPRWEATRRRIECQQCAHTWYTHLAYLQQETGKGFYQALCDAIAYTTLLSLPHDRRWRHGAWSDEMETHTRFQTDGIHLLLRHYSSSGRSEFLEAACGAADYLIEIADRLDDGALWFLHDTLEVNDDPKASRSVKTRRCRAFGKHPGNTLCLNTHAWTLSALARLVTVCRGEEQQRYQHALTLGLQGLRVVLTATTGGILYGRLYALRDTCLMRRQRSGATTPLKLYDAVLRRSLRWIKPRLARIAMPNGYIERDLERTTLSDRYVPVNMKDLALLARLTDAAWLRPYVERGLLHWLDSGLADKEFEHSPTAQQSLDAALLLASQDSRHTRVARCILDGLHRAGRNITVDALAGTVGDSESTLPRLLPDCPESLVCAHARRRSPSD